MPDPFDPTKFGLDVAGSDNGAPAFDPAAFDLDVPKSGLTGVTSGQPSLRADMLRAVGAPQPLQLDRPTGGFVEMMPGGGVASETREADTPEGHQTFAKAGQINVLPETAIQVDPTGRTPDVVEERGHPQTAVQWEAAGPVPDREEELPTGLTAAAKAGDVLSSGFVDEIAGKIVERNAGVPYELARQQARDYLERAYAKKPGEAALGTAGGIGLMAAAPLPSSLAAVRGASVPVRSAVGAAEAGGLGAFQAAGAAQPGHRREAAAEGAIPGAVLGGALPGAGALLGRVGRSATKAADRARVASTGATPAQLERLAEHYPGGLEALGGELKQAGITGPFRSAAGIAQRAEAVKSQTGPQIGALLRRAAESPGPEAAGPYREPARLSIDRLREKIGGEWLTRLASSDEPTMQNAARQVEKRLTNYAKHEGGMGIPELTQTIQDLEEGARVFEGQRHGPAANALRQLAGTLRSERKGLVDEASTRLGSPEMGANFRALNRRFGAAAEAAGIASRRQAKDEAASIASLPNIIAGGGAGAGTFLATGNPIAAGGAALAGAAGRKLIAPRAHSLTSGALDVVGGIGKAAEVKALPPLEGPFFQKLAGAAGRRGRQALRGAVPTGIAAESGAAIGESSSKPDTAWQGVMGALDRGGGALGPYARSLQDAMSRGGSRAAAQVHYVLMRRDPKYRERIKQLSSGETAEETSP